MTNRGCCSGKRSGALAGRERYLTLVFGRLEGTLGFWETLNGSGRREVGAVILDATNPELYLRSLEQRCVSG